MKSVVTPSYEYTFTSFGCIFPDIPAEYTADRKQNSKRRK